MIMLSPHFTLEELIHSDLAIRKGINNYPSADVLENLKLLAKGLETVRAILGRAVLVSSGYRCEELNAAAGGSKTSAHMKGLAADFTCPSFGAQTEVFYTLKEHADILKYDQLILEFPPSGWVHIGFAEGGTLPRTENLAYSGRAYERIA